MVRIALLLLAGLSAASIQRLAFAEPVSRPGDIPWAADRPLSWNDFQGPVDRSAAPDRVAMTAASLSWNYSYSLERIDGRCFYRITGIDVEAIFNREESWVRPEHRTIGILAHEQGHFDITQLFRLKLEALTRDLVEVRRACEGDTLAKASDFTEREAAAQVSVLAEKLWHEHVSAQEVYDEQTRHGIDGHAQSLWNERIDRGLGQESWEAIEDLLE